MPGHRTARQQLLGLLVAGLALTEANKGYDMEELPTGMFKGYCVTLDYNQPSGLCQKYEGKPKVCAVSQNGEQNPKSAMLWKEIEVFDRKAPHTDKSLEIGGQSFDFLQIFLNKWVCKQIGETVRVRSNLNEVQKQTSACNYIWRRDQEIQNGSAANGAVPTEGAPWGTFTYKPPGENLTNFIFKGIPKNQCEYDYDCRGFNSPGEVYVCCDHCEEYFMQNCEITKDMAFKFCMERAHCVCNSVKKSCAKPDKERCQGGRCREGTPWYDLGGAYYPVHGAPCSNAPGRLRRTQAFYLTSALAGLVSVTFYA